MSRMFANGALLAVAPEAAGAVLDPGVDAFIAWLTAELEAGPDPGSTAAIRRFDSEADLESYVLDPNYDNVEGFEDGKVGLAIVFQETDAATNVWRYAIRGNFTSPIFGQQVMPTVACLYDGSKAQPRECGFTSTLPPTNVPPVNDFSRPISDTALRGYSYSGFLSLQHTVDRYILQQANAGTAVQLDVSIGREYLLRSIFMSTWGFWPAVFRPLRTVFPGLGAGFLNLGGKMGRTAKKRGKNEQKWARNGLKRVGAS